MGEIRGPEIENYKKITITETEKSETKGKNGIAVRIYSCSGRHAAAQATRAAGRACPQRGRICASDFGLRSHLPSHQRPH